MQKAAFGACAGAAEVGATRETAETRALQLLSFSHAFPTNPRAMDRRMRMRELKGWSIDRGGYL